MTACVNKKHTGKVAAVVTASLVGALSLGVAAPAFAATPDKEETPTVNGAFSGNEFTPISSRTRTARWSWRPAPS